ncbi:unnamed protein product [Boreogadus saida]
MLTLTYSEGKPGGKTRDTLNAADTLGLSIGDSGLWRRRWLLINGPAPPRIGLSLAVRLGLRPRQAYKVYATMRNLAKKERLLGCVKDLHKDTLDILQMDVTNHQSILEARDRVVEKRVDILVCNAGVGLIGPLEAQGLDTMRQILEVNLLGTIQTIQAFLPDMKASGSFHKEEVNIGDVWSYVEQELHMGQGVTNKVGVAQINSYLVSLTAPVLRFEKPPQHVEIVDTGAELWTENSARSSTLVIAAAEPRHTGRYTVLVRDRRSSAQHTVTLSVIGWERCSLGGPLALTTAAARCWATWWRRAEEGPERGTGRTQPESPPVNMEPAASAGQVEEPTPAYAHVTVDCVHKVADYYTVLEKLGVGKFGQVFKLMHKESARECAGKFYKGRRAKEREAARKEIELMNFLHHPKLVQCLAAYEHRSEMVMVMELIAGGELFERIVDDSFEHTEVASVHYMQQILEGTAYMHQQDIIHLDLKPENIVCVDHTGTAIKIIDFGLASKLDPKVPLKVMHGTLSLWPQK